jgi:hypothetical protein
MPSEPGSHCIAMHRTALRESDTKVTKGCAARRALDQRAQQLNRHLAAIRRTERMDCIRREPAMDLPKLLAQVALVAQWHVRVCGRQGRGARRQPKGLDATGGRGPAGRAEKRSPIVLRYTRDAGSDIHKARRNASWARAQTKRILHLHLLIRIMVQ